MNKLLIIGLIFVFVLSISIFVFHNLNKQEQKPITTNTGVYQGPVQQGYNETLFRETGRYEKIGDNK